MSNCNCFGQSTKTIKNSSGSCFCERGCSVRKRLKAGEYYEACSMLTQIGDDKSAPYEPLTAADQCVVGFIGDCPVDAREWEEDCWVHIYNDVKPILQCVNVPVDEKGTPVLTVEDMENIEQGTGCCVQFMHLQTCTQKPEWLNNGGEKAKVA